MKKTGFIGLGIMGRPMAKNLLQANCDLYVYDSNKAVVDEFVELGAKSATLKEIGETCDVIFTILPNGKIVQDVLFGKDGICETVKEGTIVCDMSSVTPTESKTCYAKLKEMNVGFIDSPVSGGEPKAIDGTLAFMAGGEQQYFDGLKEYFDVSFINRIDNIIEFNYLNEENIKNLINEKLNKLKYKYKDAKIKINNNVIDEIIKLSNYNEYGARKLDKIIKNNIENIIIDELLEDNYNIDIKTLKEKVK